MFTTLYEKKNLFLNNIVIALLFLFVFTGCSQDGTERVSVSGTVSLDGELLNDTAIVFVPHKETKGPKARALIQEGKYHLPMERGPVIGKMRVKIVPVGIDEAGFQKLLQQGEKKPKVMRVDIPVYFNEKTRLQAEIKSENGEMVLDYKLESDKEESDNS